MKHFRLCRIANTESGMFGVYMYAGVPFAVTLEPPWLNNQPNISCIPEDTYLADLVNSPHFGKVYQFRNVPGRTDVLNHWGNRLKNTQGCVLIAEEFGKLYGAPAVLTSKNVAGKGFNEFMNLAGGDACILITIEDLWT